MSTEIYEEDETILRRNNRILRTSNRKLSARERDSDDRAEALSYSLLEADSNKSEAEIASGKLWGSGEFDCGPENYQLIVEECLTAVRMLKAAQTQDASI